MGSWRRIPVKNEVATQRQDLPRARQTDPLPGNPVVTGAWSSIRTGHELVYLGKDVVLDWQPLTGAYRLWHYDSSLTGAVDPFPAAITSGTWGSIRTGHKLVYLGPVA